MKSIKTPSAPTLQNLDDYRIGWELMKNYNYTRIGVKRKLLSFNFQEVALTHVAIVAKVCFGKNGEIEILNIWLMKLKCFTMNMVLR